MQSVSEADTPTVTYFLKMCQSRGFLQMKLQSVGSLKPYIM